MNNHHTYTVFVLLFWDDKSSSVTMDIWQIDVLNIAPCWRRSPGFTKWRSWSPVGNEIADGIHAKSIAWGPNLYWDSCSQFADDKYVIAFQMYAKTREKLVESYSNRKWPRLLMAAHVQFDHVTQRSSHLQCPLVAKIIWHFRTNSASWSWASRPRWQRRAYCHDVRG